MSGGFFDNQQFHIEDIVNRIAEYVYGEEYYDEEEVEKILSKLKYNIQRYNEAYEIEEYNYIKEHRHGIPNRHNFSQKTIEEFKKGIEILRMAKVYADRIDYLLYGDDGENSFHKRLHEDLNNLKKE